MQKLFKELVIKSNMPVKYRVKKEVAEIGGRLKEVITVTNGHGKLLHRSISDTFIEFHHKDVLQVIIGASILSVPVGFTEETWRLGINLPWLNVIGLVVLSLLFISMFTYYNYFREVRHDHRAEFLKRVIWTYVLSLFVVAIILSLIQVAPWLSGFSTALKRTVIVAFPASLSGAIADVIK